MVPLTPPVLVTAGALVLASLAAGGVFVAELLQHDRVSPSSAHLLPPFVYLLHGIVLAGMLAWVGSTSAFDGAVALHLWSVLVALGSAGQALALQLARWLRPGGERAWNPGAVAPLALLLLAQLAWSSWATRWSGWDGAPLLAGALLVFASLARLWRGTPRLDRGLELGRRLVWVAVVSIVTASWLRWVLLAAELPPLWLGLMVLVPLSNLRSALPQDAVALLPPLGVVGWLGLVQLEPLPGVPAYDGPAATSTLPTLPFICGSVSWDFANRPNQTRRTCERRWPALTVRFLNPRGATLSTKAPPDRIAVNGGRDLLTVDAGRSSVMRARYPDAVFAYPETYTRLRIEHEVLPLSQIAERVDGGTLVLGGASDLPSQDWLVLCQAVGASACHLVFDEFWIHFDREP